MVNLDFLPFDGSWLTFWGGDTPEQNHHHDTASQKYAFDFIMTDAAGKFFHTNGKSCEDYFSFGQNIIAPAEGEVIETVDGLRDNKPGELNSFNFIGNYVMLKQTDNVFLVLGHLRQNSVLVKPNQKIKAGDKIGECGNSGYSTDPHLHMHAQSSSVFARVDKNYKRVDVAKGCMVKFASIRVQTDSKAKTLANYSPVKGDKVSNV